MRLIAILFVILYLPASGLAQIQTENPLRFERFTIDQGLTADRVYSITQDNLGYIWLATDGGVSRYDGYGFAAYRNIPDDPSSLTDNFVHAVYTDSKGDVWVGTRYGLNRYVAASDNFERYYHTPGDQNTLPHSSVHSIYESASGRLWMGTENGLAEYDRETGRFISEWEVNGVSVSLSGSMVTTIAGDKNGRLWIGTNNRGLVAYQPRDNTLRFMNEDPSIRIPFPSVNISRIMVDSNGELWIGFLQDSGFRASLEVLLQYGLARFNPQTMEFKLYSHDPENGIDVWYRISDIIEDSDNTIWVTSYLGDTYTGLHRFNRDTETFTRYSHNPNDQASLTWSYSQAVFEDRYRNLWVGTSRGLNKADLGRWQMGFMTVDPSVPFNLINNFYGIEEVGEDLFWLGLDGPGIIKWNRGNHAIEHIVGGSPIVLSGSIHVIRKDPDGYIWLGNSGQGLIRHDPATGNNEYYQYTENEAGSIAGNYITDIRIARDSTVWVATSNGLSRYNRHNNTFTNFRQETHSAWMTGNALSSLLEDRHGNIWIGTNRHVYDPAARNATGLIKWNPVTNQYRTFRHNASKPGTLSNDAIYAVAEDSNGDIWVATNNGLNRYLDSEDRFEVYLESDGLPSPVIIGVLFDDDGYLWMSTMNGLARLDPENGAIRVFSKADNVQANRFNENSFFKNSRGELMFGGVAGLNYFDPSVISGTDVIPEMLITGVTVNDETARFAKSPDETESITLGWTENSVGFEYTAINFRSAGLTQYEYMLQGFDADWIRAGTRRFTNYTNLGPGTYRFMVRAQNADGILSIDDAAIVLTIQPPWWRTWWAYGFYVILFVAGVVTADRIQRRKVRQIEREKAREKELGQAREIEKAYTKLKSTQAQLIHSEKMASLGELTAGIAHEIQNPLNFVNNFSEVSTELVTELDDELDKGEIQEAKLISNDIKQNLEKINHHGRRADAIVKGMLAHSRTGTGEKEPTDLNALADEYLRLSYHGLRAKDKDFNADFRTDFDPNLPKVNVVSQDIGRVLLNLINNAFQACSGHHRSARAELDQNARAGLGQNAGAGLDQSAGAGLGQNAGAGLDQSAGAELDQNAGAKLDQDLESGNRGNPMVTVTTRYLGDNIVISVSDNGPGIPDSIKDKIFQPFFTTKPTGQGTGLGLSLSYDIVKAHGGNLDIQSRPGETIFTITLNMV